MWRPRRAHRPAYIEVRLLGSLYEGGPRLRVGDADEEMLVIGPARSNLNGAVPMYLEVSRNLLDHVNAVGAVAVNGENVVGDFNEESLARLDRFGDRDPSARPVVGME